MSNDSIEDKLVLARRGALSDPDRRRLEIALNTSESSRALYETGVAFDRMHTDGPNDRELLARVSASTSARMLGGQARNPRKRGKLTLLAAAILVVSGAAAASLWHLQQTGGSRPVATPIAARSPGEGAAAAGPDRGRARPASNEPAVPSDVADEPDDDTTEPPPEAARLTPPVAARSQSAPHRDAPSIEDAAGLFKNANDARKAGDSERALSLYQTLRRRFPASPEAQVSLVLGGRLLLASGQANRALSLFDQYLKAGAPGGLAEEALSGKAHALSELGRTAEERQVWRVLLRQFPKSVYVRKARERLR